MNLKDKKIAFLGDSITEGHGTTSIEHTFWNVLAKRTGALSYGYGIGGTRVAPQRKPSENPVYDLFFGSRVDEMIPDADIVVAFGGTNDYGHGDAALGTMADRTEDTFYGSLHLLMRKLIERYPEALIVFMTPLHRLGESGRDYNEFGVRNTAKLQAYVDAIIEVAAYYGIPVLDLFRVSGIQPEIPAIRERYMPDGLHPSDAGHERIADRLIGFLETL